MKDYDWFLAKLIIGFFIGVILATMLTGCAVVNGTRHPDGTLEIKSSRWFWKTEDLDFSASEATNGVLTVTLKAKASSPDAASITAAGAVASDLLGQAIKAAAK